MDVPFDQNYFEEFPHSKFSQFSKKSVESQEKAQAVSNLSAIIQRITEESELTAENHSKAEKSTKSILRRMGYPVDGNSPNSGVRRPPNIRQQTNGQAVNGSNSSISKSLSAQLNIQTRKRRRENELSETTNNGEQPAKVPKIERNRNKNQTFDQDRLFSDFLAFPIIEKQSYDDYPPPNGNRLAWSRKSRRSQKKELLEIYNANSNKEFFEKYKQPLTPKSNLISMESRNGDVGLNKNEHSVPEQSVRRAPEAELLQPSSLSALSYFKCHICNAKLKSVEQSLLHASKHFDDNTKLPTCSDKVSNKKLSNAKKSRQNIVKKERNVKQSSSKSKRSAKSKQDTAPTRKRHKASSKAKKGATKLNEVDKRPLISHADITKDDVIASVKAIRAKTNPDHLLGDRLPCFEQMRARQSKLYCDFCAVVNWADEDEWFKHFSRCKNHVDGWSYCALCDKSWKSGMCFELHWDVHHSELPLPTTKHYLVDDDPVDPTLRRLQ